MSGGKAAGINGVLVEMLKSSKHVLVRYICALFNNILKTGVYPSRWTESVLCPIYKKGCPTDPSNYRGISLLSIVGKIFTKLLKNRFVRWEEDNVLQYEEQAGYKKGYSTIDNMFTLQSLVQKYISKENGQYYVLFIDFSKAFDMIPHSLLWYKLIKSGIHGRTLNVLRDMYSKMKACVKTKQGLTEFFNCTIGTRQGCMLSPFLFSFYIGELVQMLNDSGCEGTFVNEDFTDIKILLYADDIATGGDSVGRLHRIINEIERFCDHWGLLLNMTKSKLVVFSRGGIVKNIEKWYFKGKEIEVVSMYKYLGLIFTLKLNWSLARKTLASQANKALGLLYMYNKRCGGLPVNINCELFDKIVSPILLYGAEIWGYEYCESIETVQITSYRRILGVGLCTPKQAIMGEVGKYPVALYYYSRCIEYWFKILCMTDHRYPKVCYSMLKVLDERGRITWASHIRCLLERYGFSFVWISQGVGDVDVFMKIFKTKLQEHFKNTWFTDIGNTSKLEIYSTFKREFEPERYLNFKIIKSHRQALSRLRCSSHMLQIEVGRHKNMLMADRLCVFCKELDIIVLEDEYHFLMLCPAYTDLRSNYLFIQNTSYSNFIEILTETDEK